MGSILVLTILLGPFAFIGRVNREVHYCLLASRMRAVIRSKNDFGSATNPAPFLLARVSSKTTLFGVAMRKAYPFS
jgi:hypothetical protein